MYLLISRSGKFFISERDVLSIVKYFSQVTVSCKICTPYTRTRQTLYFYLTRFVAWSDTPARQLISQRAFNLLLIYLLLTPSLTEPWPCISGINADIYLLIIPNLHSWQYNNPNYISAVSQGSLKSKFLAATAATSVPALD